MLRTHEPSPQKWSRVSDSSTRAFFGLINRAIVTANTTRNSKMSTASREQTASKRRSKDASLITMGTIASTLEEARASLKQPTRPFTPAQYRMVMFMLVMCYCTSISFKFDIRRDERHMFNGADTQYSSRPSTAYGYDPPQKNKNLKD